MRWTSILALPAALALGACVYDLDFSTLSGSTGTTGACTPGSTLSCYDGPAGTEGVGICKGGSKTCAADGAGWGPCVGEVLPEPVDCASGVDKHCDGKVSPCKGALLWAEGFGDASDQFGSGVGADSSWNVLVTGSFNGGIDFGTPTSPLTSAGGRDIFVAKLDPSGKALWSKGYGDVADQFGAGITTDATGDVLVTGNFAGTVDFGGGKLTAVSPGDVFALKLGASGDLQWGKRFGGPGGQTGYGIATDPAGNVVLAGVFYDTITFGTTADTLQSAGAGDIFLAKLDPAGNYVWSKSFGDAANQTAYAVATDAAGDVFLTGTFLGTVDFGGGALTSAGGGDIFVAAFDSQGEHKWSKRFGDASDQIGYGIAADPTGNVRVTGALYGSLDPGGTLPPLTSAGDSDVFVLALDPAGNTTWAKSFGDKQEQIGYAIALDPSGSTVVTGAFNGLVDFGGGPLTTAGQTDVFVAKLDDTGAWLWSRRAGSTGSDGANGVTTDAAGNVLVIGSFAQAVDFGGTSLTSMGGEDVFVAKYGP